MRTLIVTDDESLGARLRRALLSKGRECPPECIVRHSAAREILASSSKTELVVLDVGRDAGEATSVVSRLRAAVAGRLVAIGELGTVRDALHVRRAGADEYVEAADALTELSVILDGPGPGGASGRRRGRVLAVLSPSGGGGASTLAVNLAVILATEARQDVALLDLVPVRGSLADLLDLKPVHTLADIVEAPDRLDADILERTLVRHDSGVLVLGSPRRFDAQHATSGEAIDRLIDLTRARFPFVVLDLDRDLGPSSLQAAARADVVVLTFRQEFISLRDARQTIDHLERHGIETHRIWPVAARQGQPRELPVAKVEEALRLKLCGAITDDPRAVIRAANNGVPVVIESRSSRAAKAITNLARKLRTHLESCVEVR